MFNEIIFETMEKLPNYVFAEVGKIKMDLRRKGKDVIDFSMGNPDGPTPKHIINKLIEASKKDKNHGYSSSIGIYKLRLAISNWYKRRYNANIDPNTEAIATMGSKDGYVHLIQAIANDGDIAIVPEPTYPIHSYAFSISGAKVRKMGISFNDDYELDEDKFLSELEQKIDEDGKKAKFVLVNFPHNPTCVTVTENFYERLVKLAKEKRFYIISDIAYADLTYDGYKTPSILSVKGAKDVAIESFTLSKSYNMAGWRVGFFCGNAKLVGALQKLKSWTNYGMFTPIQVASTIALNGPQGCVEDIKMVYQKRRDVLVDSFANAGWKLNPPKSTMFIWAKIPEQLKGMKSLEFSKKLLSEANVAVSPGGSFGEYGDDYVRIALLENKNRIRQAGKNIKKFLKEN